jgi:photosystem II stability/assembly factor-like uncharacterized protein
MVLAGWGFVARAEAPYGNPIDPKFLSGLAWRSIGPAHFSGRVTDIAGVPGNPDIIYVAFGTAGLFRSANGGITFTPIFENSGTLSIGAIALDPRDPNTIYCGTGEGNVRNSVSFGDGLYKSADGGKTWKHLGLRDTERFGRIVVSPKDPNVVFAAALGHEWGPNRERGLYRSTDTGATWKQVLYVDETTGASDVAIDPADPNIVYCGMYDFLRQPWHFRSGGPGSGLYRSTDGGETWTKLTDPKLGNGLPGKGLIGRIGVSVCVSDPNVVYAMIESEEPGELWRSADRGLHWTLVSDDPQINNRPFYYSDVHADARDPDRVYALAGGIFVSTDGGRTWDDFAGYESLFGDHHALWIDSANPDRILNGNDGGLYLSNDRGKAWEFLNNMPSAQAYHVSVDMAEPYNVMGGFQDHEIWVGPSEKWNEVGVRGGDWIRLRDMADGMYALADPRDPNIIYYNGHFGDITRIDLRNREERFIQPYPLGPTGTGVHMDLYRFAWNSPIHISPNDPDVVYYGGNVLFKTRDGGHSWEIISPDLTTNDKAKQQLSGGPITPDNTRAEAYCAIQGLSESPLDPNVIWVGTDDGNVQLTRDGGKTWTNLSPNIAGLPKQACISTVWASPHAAGGAYIAVDQHRLDDFAPYAFVTDDFGKTWRPISKGLLGWVHVVKEDPKAPGLLYAGTELGVFASFDAGANWTDLRLGIPPVQVVDLVVHPKANDLVIATHARGFYILDDVTPLQELVKTIPERAALHTPMPPVRYTPASDTSTLGDKVYCAPNKPYGAIISYWLAEPAAEGKVRLEVLNAHGIVLRELDGPGAQGINRVVWDLREDLKSVLKEIKADPGFRPRGEGMKVMPGEYMVRLRAAGTVLERTFTVRSDPRIKAAPEDLAAYESSVRRLIRISVSIEAALDRIEKAEEKLSSAEKTAGGATRKRIAARRAELETVKAKLRPPRLQPENLNLSGKLSWLVRQVGGYTGKPTKAQSEYIGILEGRLRQVLEELAKVPAVS